VAIAAGVVIESVGRIKSGHRRGPRAPRQPSTRAATALLIRHAHTDAIGAMLAGRMAGVPLSDTGIAQAERLGRALSVRFNFAGIYSSPLERAHETAAALARHQGLDVQSCPDLSEIDYGAWTGKTFL
jgi:broad specificity phosphatase PhoE